jgi:putative NADPH-quinone reductase
MPSRVPTNPPPAAQATKSTGLTSPVKRAQEEIARADHIVILFPLWLGAMPGLLKGFFEQVFRPGFAIAEGKRTLSPGLLKGKSARVVVTMGMPGFFYRLFFFAHSLRSLRRNILYFVGIKPVRETLIGSVENAASRERALETMQRLGREAR